MKRTQWRKYSRKNGDSSKKAKTINTQDSLLVTDATTNKATMGLNYAEQTGSVLVPFLWSIAKSQVSVILYIPLTVARGVLKRSVPLPIVTTLLAIPTLRYC